MKGTDKNILEYTELRLETLLPRSMTSVIMLSPIRVLRLLMTKQNDRL